MVSGINKSIKVAWICHFSNDEVQKVLKPRKSVREIAPWIPSLAKLLEGQQDIELHIISPYKYITRNKHFNLKGIHYHFFNAQVPYIGRNWPKFFKFDNWTNFVLNKIKVKIIIKNIQPDIIHLHGAENAYYSSAIFQFRNRYPILVTIQGFLFKVADLESNRHLKKRVDCELKIYKTFQHFGIRTITMGKEIMELNPHAIMHWHGYISEVENLNEHKNVEKKYDLVYFARLVQIKGIEDLLTAIAVLKNQKADITCLIIGNSTGEYLEKLKKYSHDLGIENNLTWAGFLPTKIDVHNAASMAKICVLPVKYDMIPGTIVESMLLKIPVVAYDVGSIHEVNEKEDILTLVRKDDISGLADAIMMLLNDENLQKDRAEKGYFRALELVDNRTILNDLKKAYHEVIGFYNNFH